jgi:DNA-binding response OmpR family regulator
MTTQTTLSILVVDDESELRELLVRLFTRDGHRVLAVADARSAIDRATTEAFDCVLLDVALGPGPDGVDVCRELRARRNVVPIIMLTARDSEADAVLGLEAGADDYVTKPFGAAPDLAPSATRSCRSGRSCSTSRAARPEYAERSQS